MATKKAKIKSYTFLLINVWLSCTSFTKIGDNKVGPVSLVDV